MAHIFIIEHDPEFADCLQKILNIDGYEVTCISDIADAIRTMPELKPNLAIVDMDDGGNVLPADIERLTTLSNKIPVLVTAVFRTPELAFKALGAGATDYILKPFGTEEILKLVRIHTSNKITFEKPEKNDRISDSIRILDSIEDILKTSLNQLSNTLHLADCLIALRDGNFFRVQASRGYSPNPVSNTVELPGEDASILMSENMENVARYADIVNDTVSRLGIRGSRPFSTLMPLIGQSGGSDELMGFVLGHGAIILEENDYLEMERFLNVMVKEIAGLMETGSILEINDYYLFEGEYQIPETPRDQAISEILSIINPFLAVEKDLFWLRLAMDEAINNAIVHGHLEPLNRPITNLYFKYQVSEERIALFVKDGGDGFDYNHIPDPTAEENLMNINGRGIYLMKKIMDSVSYNDRGNQITLIKYFNGIPLNPF
ncbi:MAG: ATP-binding protein [bacterium]|nr:ATP-binding protein [bacterium]